MIKKKFTKEDEIRDFLIKWFESKIYKEVSLEELDKDYFQLDWIDSFEVINLIEELQNKYKFEFEENHFQHSDFSSINGLTKLIIKLSK